MCRPVENIKTTRAPGTRECNAHARHERRVKNDSGDLVARSQVNGRNSANALAIKNNVVWINTVARPQCQPRCLYVCIHILLRRPSRAHAVSGIIITAKATIHCVNTIIFRVLVSEGGIISIGAPNRFARCQNQWHIYDFASNVKPATLLSAAKLWAAQWD